MPPVPLISSREAIKAFEKIGYERTIRPEVTSFCESESRRICICPFQSGVNCLAVRFAS